MARQTSIKVPQPEPKRLSLHDTVLEVLTRFGPRKQGVLAAQLGASDGHLSEVMKGNGGKHWPPAWLDYIAEHYDFEASIAQHFASLRGQEVRPPRSMPAREELRRIKYTLSQHNAIGAAIQAEARALPDEIFAEDEP